MGWLMNPSRRTPLAIDYEAGLRAAIAEFSVPDAKVTTIEHCSPDVNTSAAEAIRRALHGVLSKPNRPTAIFCGNMPDAEQVYLQAEAFGLKIPRDLSLVAFGGTWRPHGLAERISCIAVDEYDVGAKAAEMLHEMRSGKRALDNDERIVFPVTLLPGETIGHA
jgi:DNA-binding LacI/PurR family transcriptional regulator